MPLPGWAASAAIGALQNPEIQNALLGAGSAVLGGTGRATDYALRGLGGAAQWGATGLADILGGLGEQYLPENVNWAGGKVRDLNRYLSQGAAGLYNAALGTNQQQQMPGMMGGMQPAMAGQMGQMGPQQMTPQQMMQQYYQQQIQQDQLGNQQQQYRNQYNQELGQLSARFGGNLNRGSFRRAATGALGNLQTNLGALSEQSRLQRLGQIAPYLQGQQDLGLRSRGLGQQGTIAQRQDALQQLGAMGGFGQQQQQNYQTQLLNMLNAQGNLGNLAQGQAFQNLQVGGQAPWWQQALGSAASGFGKTVGGGFNRAMGI